MYAIIAAGGHQYTVKEGQVLDIDLQDAPKESEITFDRVLAYGDGTSVKIGRPTIAGATVTADLVGPVKGPKLVVQKFRRRKNSRRRTGHRQLNSRIVIKRISV